MILKHKDYLFDLQHSLDISIPLKEGEQLNCYYAPPFRIEPVIMGDFIGDIKKGGLLNFKNVFLNPHGNGTHTECLSHIADIDLSINKALTKFHFIAQLITLTPLQTENGDMVITKKQLEEMVVENMDALIIRTLPNSRDKLLKNYNKTNPPYLDVAAAELIRENNFTHLLIDLPSVDKEEDGGKLAAHHAFWNYPEKPRFNATITELIFVPDEIIDGIYLLNLQIAPFELDATPSKPVLYKRF